MRHVSLLTVDARSEMKNRCECRPVFKVMILFQSVGHM